MMLDKIYNVYTNDDEIQDTRELTEKIEKLEKVSNLMVYQAEKEINDFAAASEKQGFINGFKYAVKIFSECANTVKLKTNF